MNDDDLGRLYIRAVIRPGRDDGCPSPEALQAVAERMGREEERLAVLEHVAACADCQRELALLAQVAASRPRARRSPVPVGWLAAAAVVVLAFAGVRALATRGREAPVMRGDEPAVTLVAPAGQVAAGPAGLLFVWHPVPGATRYQVEVLGPDEEPVATATVRDTVMAQPDGLRAGVGYRWHVIALRADGTRVDSPVVRFDLTRE